MCLYAIKHKGYFTIPLLYLNFTCYIDHQNCNGVYTFVISYIIFLCNNTSSVIANMRIMYIICIYTTECVL
jgi:hypothetical protein